MQAPSLLLAWRHSGFNIYCGPTIWPNNDQGLEDLARYIIRACFSQKRMNYLPAKDSRDGQARVICQSKDGRSSKTFEALDWLAQLVTHIPNKGERTDGALLRLLFEQIAGHAQKGRRG